MDIKGKVRFKVNGLNIEKLLNKLYSTGIPLYAVTRKQYKKLSFTVNTADSKKVIACLENLCYNYTKEEEKGIFPFIKAVIKRTGLIAGVILFALVSVASSFFVYEIRVKGCNETSVSDILQKVKEAGAAEKSFFRADSRQIERALYSSFSNVAFVSVYYKGVVLYINIVETQQAPQVLETEPRDLVATQKGKISRLIVHQGTPLVKAGDTVEKGQIIIGGYRESPNGERIQLRAMGEAYGVIELDYSEPFYKEKTILSRSGRKTTVQYIEFFGMNFPQKTPQITYTTYETEQTYSYMFNNNFLPAKLVTITYYETLSVTVTEDFEKVKTTLISEAEKKAIEDAKDKGKVTSFQTTLKEEDKIIYIQTKVFAEKSLF